MRKKIFILLVLLQLVQLAVAAAFNSYYIDNEDPFHYDNDHFNEKYPVVEDVDGNEITELQYQCDPKKLNTLEVYLAPNILQSAISSNDQIHDTEDEVVYFFHGDHLGSAHWITNYKGDAIQYLHYAPYGELMANQQVTGRPYDERFKFTGKERDSETNYDYFGARFYSSLLGHWFSVDPLSDKYPNISPYAYCGWNPVEYVDPNGREKHNQMDPDSEDVDACRLWAGTNACTDIDGPYILFISHGSQNSMTPAFCDGDMSAQDFKDYLFENSAVWKNTEDKSTITIILISCETGRGDAPIAQKISEIIPEATIIAPTEKVWAFTIGENTMIGGNGKAGALNTKDLARPEYQGQWRFYKNGYLDHISPDGLMYHIYPKIAPVQSNSDI